MAKYGIIGAMDVEVNHIIDKFYFMGITTETISGNEFHSFTFSDNEFVIAKCGPGKVNSAVCAVIMILFYDVDAIINIGVAGAYKDIPIGSIVVSDKSVQIDVDTSAVGDEVGFVSGVNKKYFESSKYLGEFIASKIYPYKLFEVSNSKFLLTDTIIGPVGTSDTYITNKSIVDKVVNSFGVISFDMETASIAQVCHINNIDFVSCRVITDNCSGVEYKNNLDKLALAFSKFMVYTMTVLPSKIK